MTTVEPEWDDDTRAQALALQIHEDGLCPCGCGQPAVESQAAANEFAYQADGPHRCHARTAILRAQEAQGDHPFERALLWGVQFDVTKEVRDA